LNVPKTILSSLTIIVLFSLSAYGSEERLYKSLPPHAYKHMLNLIGPTGSPASVSLMFEETGSELIVSAIPIGDASRLVIVFGGSEGGIPYIPKLTKAIVANGYPMVGIAYHGAKGTPPHVKEIPLEPIITRINEFAHDAQGNRRCVALVGVSKGAELVLVIAAKADIADATVAVVPSNVVWQSSEVSLSRHSSWTYNNEPLPFVQYPWFSKGTLTYLTQGPTQAKGIHEAAFKNTTLLEEASIAVESISKPVLLQGAKQDTVWPSHEMSLATMQRVEDKNPNHKFQLLSYDLGHFLMANQEAVDDTMKFITQAFDANPNCKNSGVK